MMKAINIARRRMMSKRSVKLRGLKLPIVAPRISKVGTGGGSLRPDARSFRGNWQFDRISTSNGPRLHRRGFARNSFLKDYRTTMLVEFTSASAGRPKEKTAAACLAAFPFDFQVFSATIRQTNIQPPRERC
jgi:hypothetical protein